MQGRIMVRMAGAAQLLVAGGAVAWSLRTFPAEALRPLLTMLAVSLALQRVPVMLQREYVLPASIPIQSAGLLLLPPQAAVLMETVMSLTLAFQRRSGLSLALFNTANNVIPSLAAIALFRWVHPDWQAPVTGT
ncbi:MAG TPA: hypothetical protein VD902_03615, partial [Symbiobacteriaceae bacterium]|nr:hypothetical protein [Symbiobacteriaceae bacterium]